MITKELERNGIPTVQITTMTPIALMIGSNRIVPGAGIIHPVGNPELSPVEEKKLRRALVQKALSALELNLNQQQLFERVT